MFTYLLLLLLVNFGARHVFLSMMAEAQLSRTQKQFEAADRQIAYLVMGDSHPKRGVNPRILGSAFNFASAGETHIQTYYKLRHVLERSGKQVETVLLSCDLHTFAGCRSHMPHNWYYWARYVDPLEVGLRRGKLCAYLARYLQGRFAPYSGEFITVVRYLGYEGRTRIVDGWEPASSGWLSEPEKILAARRKAAYHFPDSGRPDECLIEYFSMSLELCKQKGVGVVAVRYPVTPQYHEAMMAKAAVANIDDAVRTVLAGHPECRLLDFSDAFFGRDDRFHDVDHLNEHGAGELSRQLRNLLEGAPSEAY